MCGRATEKEISESNSSDVAKGVQGVRAHRCVCGGEGADEHCLGKSLATPLTNSDKFHFTSQSRDRLTVVRQEIIEKKNEDNERYK